MIDTAASDSAPHPQLSDNSFASHLDLTQVNRECAARSHALFGRSRHLHGLS